jgi:hypothetical protein
MVVTLEARNINEAMLEPVMESVIVYVWHEYGVRRLV